MNWQEKYGEWALVTGASSGIGRAFACDLARRGLDIILVARRTEKLKQVAAECESLNRKTCICPVDLAQPNALQKVSSFVADKEIGVLVNNAGILARGTFWETDIQRQLDMVTLNCTVPLAFSHHFLRGMLTRNRGAIITVASLTAYYFQPFLTTYAATKTFDWRFARSLSWELRKTGIDSLLVVPGFTKTEAFEAANWAIDFESIPSLFKPQPPQNISKKSLDVLGKKRSIVLTSFIESMIINANRVLPDNLMEFILAKMFA